MNARIVPIALVLLVLGTAAYAQGPILTGGRMQTGTTGSTFGGAYYNFAGESGCDFLISVWGFVANPGRYNVPCETNLLDLLSYCGGPRRGAFLDKIRIIRRGGVDQQDEIAKVFDVDVEKYLQLRKDSTQATDLLLYPRDLVIVDGEDKSTVDYVLRVSQVIVAVASVATATVAIINITKK